MANHHPALRFSVGFWFCVMAIGLLGFAYYIAAFYGLSTLVGEPEIWNRLEVFGRQPYQSGDYVGNLSFLSHVLAAAIVAIGGLLQLIPKIRARYPAFHRWNGRVFIAVCVGLSLSGYFLVWALDRSPGRLDAIATSINGALILWFAWRALSSARIRAFDKHYAWAVRLFLVANAQWFLRIGQFGYFVACRAFGVEPGSGFFAFWTFGCFLLPLLIFEIYRANRDNRQTVQWSLATGLTLGTILLLVGIVPFSIFAHALVTGQAISLGE